MNDFEREPLYMIGKRESESITEIEFDRRHDSRLVNSCAWRNKRRIRTWKGEKEGLYIVHRAGRFSSL